MVARFDELQLQLKSHRAARPWHRFRLSAHPPPPSPSHLTLPCPSSPSGVACLFDTFVYFSYAFHIDFRAWASLRTSCLCIEFQTNRLARFGLCCACCVCECVPCHSLFPLLFRFHVPFSYFCVCFALHLINFYALFVFKYFSLNRYNIFSACPSTLSPSPSSF